MIEAPLNRFGWPPTWNIAHDCRSPSDEERGTLPRHLVLVTLMCSLCSQSLCIVVVALSIRRVSHVRKGRAKFLGIGRSPVR